MDFRFNTVTDTKLLPELGENVTAAQRAGDLIEEAKPDFRLSANTKTKQQTKDTQQKTEVNENETALQPLNGTNAPKSTSKTSTADSVPN